MPEFSKIFTQNKKILFPIVLMGLIFLLTPLYFAEAQAGGWCDGCGVTDLGTCFSCIGQWIASIPLRFAFFWPALTFAILVLFFGFIYAVTTALVMWIAEVSMNIPITPSNPLMSQDFIISQAWRFTRDLADMFLILILAFIGLATILKLREYEVKKLLPTLIIVALLINFSPVIVGFIVDLGNIMGNFFLRAAASYNSLGDIWERFVEYLLSTLRIFTLDGHFFERLFTLSDENLDPCPVYIPDKCEGNYAAQMVGIFTYGGVLAVFYVLATIVYFYVGILFFARTVFLWLIVILAPIVFLFYAVPATFAKKFRQEWWQNLIGWSIIGIPIGFFLWISNWIMNAANQESINSMFATSTLTAYTTSTALTGPTASATTTALFSTAATGLGPLFISILAPSAALLLLYYGTKKSREYAPKAALAIMDAVNKGFKLAATGALAAATLGVGAVGMAGLLGKTAAGAGKLSGAMGRIPGVGKPLQGLFGKPLAGTTKLMERVTVPRLLRYAARVREAKIPAEFDKMTPQEQQMYVESQLTKASRVKIAAKMADSGTLGKTSQGFRDKIAAEAEGLSEDSTAQKEVSKIFDVLPNKITMKAKIGLESPENKQKMQQEIDKMSGEISAEININPQLEGGALRETFSKYNIKLTDAEKQNLENFQGLSDSDKNLLRAKATTQQKESAIKDIAAGAIHTRELKPGDIKNVAKGSLNTAAFRFGSQEFNFSHLQRIQDEFGKEELDKVLENPGGLSGMFKDKTPDQAREILDKLYKKNPRLVSSLATTPAGRAMAWEGLKHLRDPMGQSTNSFDAYERRVRLEEVFSKLSPTEKPLEIFNNLHTAASKHQREIEDAEERIKGLRLRGQPTTTWEAKRDLARQQFTSVSQDIARMRDLQIKPHPNLRRKWEEIAKLRGEGGFPPETPPPPPRPAEVPPQWVPGPRGAWVPPTGYATKTYTRAEENTMVKDVRDMTKELNRLRKQPIKSTEDEEAIKMLEATIRDIRQRLGK